MGGWKKANPFSAEYPSWNTLLVLYVLNQVRVRALVESLGADFTTAGASPAAGVGGEAAAAVNTSRKELTGFWQSINDEAAIELRGVAPLAAPIRVCIKGF
jgi:hypothetical protein